MKFFVAVAACLAVAPGARAEPSAVALRFAHLSTIQDVSISPDGGRLAIIGAAAKGSVLSIAKVDSDEVKPIELGEIDAARIYWVGDKHLVATLGFWLDYAGIETRGERSVILNIDGNRGPPLFPHDTLMRNLREQKVAGVMPGASPKFLLYGFRYEGYGGARRVLWSLDPATGEGEIAATSDDSTREFGYAPEGGLYRIEAEHDTLLAVEVPKTDHKGWNRVWISRDKSEIGRFIGYSPARRVVYLLKDEADASALLAKSVDDGAVTTVADWSEPIAGFRRDQFTQEPVAVVHAGSPDTLDWIDPDLGHVHAATAKALKGRSVSLVSWSRDRIRFVIRAASPDKPSDWYLYDRARRELSPIGNEYPALAQEALGVTEWVTYPARDGAPIHAYATKPPKASGPVPLVVLPHGGPAMRDDNEFDLYAQFLATRGYAVLRPQFRGSSGFGHAFEKAGDREWGGKMQTDLLDGVAALAKVGAIDPSRVCIMGTGYGGYAALAAVSLYADTYRCAISIEGVSDLRKMVSEPPKINGRDDEGLDAWRKQLAKIGLNDPLTAQISPARHAGDIRAPVLMIQLPDDPYASDVQSDLMREALTTTGHPAEFLRVSGVDRNLGRMAERLNVLETLGAFLAKNLPVNP